MVIADTQFLLGRDINTESEIAGPDSDQAVPADLTAQMDTPTVIQAPRILQVDNEETPPSNAPRSSSGEETIQAAIAYDNAMTGVGGEPRVALQGMDSAWFRTYCPI